MELSVSCMPRNSLRRKEGSAPHQVGAETHWEPQFQLLQVGQASSKTQDTDGESES